MCGHVGFISKWSTSITPAESRLFQEMLLIDQLRGEDGTGITVIGSDQGVDVFKGAETFQDFAKAAAVRSGLQRTQGVKALLGHNRKTTSGGSVDVNTHPFVFDDRYVFAHNGTLHNHRVALSNTEVDSVALGDALVRLGGEPTAIGKVLDKVMGAWACVWYDNVENKLFFLRNEQRPLSFVFTEGGDMAYASEAWMASVALERNGKKVKRVKSADPRVLYTLDLSKTGDIVLEETSIPFSPKAPGMYTPTTAVIPTKKGKKQPAYSLEMLAQDLTKQDWQGFFVEKVRCAVANPEPGKVYDWILTGGCADLGPDVHFIGTIQNLFPYEAHAMERTRTFVEGYVTMTEINPAWNNQPARLLVTMAELVENKGQVC
jgi:hypothetical protein